MPRSLRSQRRLPRVPLRVWASLAHRGAEWRIETEDVGPGGCLVRSERLLVPGLDVHIVLQKSASSEELSAEGKVAWYDAPRAGIAFDPRRAKHASAWVRKLLTADRRLAQAAARVPTEIEFGTRLFLPTPPKIVDLYPDEALIVGCAEQGIPLGDLVARSGLSDQRLGQVVFGLLEKRVLTLAAGEAGEAWKWRAALAARAAKPGLPPREPGPRAAARELSLAIASAAVSPPSTSGARPPQTAGRTAPSPGAETTAATANPTAAAARTEAQARTQLPTPILTRTQTPIPTSTPTRPYPLEPQPAAAQPAAAQPAAPAPAAAAPARPVRPAGAAFMARILRGVGSKERPPGATAEINRAREAEAAGRVAEAMGFMRRALAMAPQDREIAGEIARLAFLDSAP